MHDSSYFTFSFCAYQSQILYCFKWLISLCLINKHNMSRILDFALFNGSEKFQTIISKPKIKYSKLLKNNLLNTKSQTRINCIHYLFFPLPFSFSLLSISIVGKKEVNKLRLTAPSVANFGVHVAPKLVLLFPIPKQPLLSGNNHGVGTLIK